MDSKRGGWARPYHSFVALVLLLAGGALLGYGVYLRLSKYHSQAFLDFARASNGSTNVLQVISQFDIAAMIVGAFVMLSGLIALIAVGRNCCGSLFRVVFFILALVILAALIGIAGLSFYLFHYQGQASFKTDTQALWAKQVQSSPNVICSIENSLRCRGFDNNNCATCPFGIESTCTQEEQVLCAKCSSKKDYVAVGCFDKFRHALSRWYIIIGSVASGLALMQFVDLFALCQL
jgi:Tetraspanin family